MKSKITLVARLLLGFVFFAGGLVGLLNLVPPPPDLPERLQTFNNGLLASRYFFPFLKGTETVCGILLLSGMYVPLALVVLAPIVINIVMVHIFLDPATLPIAIVIGILTAYLAFFSETYAPAIKRLFQRKPA